MKHRLLHAVLFVLLLNFQVFGEPSPAVSELMKSGNRSVKEGKWAEAESSFRQATLKDPKYSRAWYGLGDSLYELKRHKEALVCLQTVLSLDPTNAGAQFTLGNCYYVLKDYEQGAQCYGNFIAMMPEDAAGYYWRGTCLSEMEKFTEAEKDFRKAIVIKGEDPAAHEKLGYCLTELKRYAEAIPVYEKALTLSDHKARDQFWLGYCFFRTKNYSRARELLERYVSSAPDDEEGPYWLGSTLYELKMYPQAESAFTKALAIKPDGHLAHKWRGYTLLKLKSYAQAADEFKQAARLKSDNYLYHYLCGNALFLARQYSEAVGEFEKARVLNKEDKKTKYLLFTCYFVNGKYRKAWELYPVAAGVGGGLLLLCFAVGSGLLLKKSFRITVAATPGLGFTIVWILLYFESHAACSLFGPAFGADVGSILIAATLLAPIPLLAASLLAFPSQPWGSPFALPCSISWKRLGFCWLLLFLTNFASSCIVVIIKKLAHRADERPNNLKYLQEMMQTHPVLALLAVAVIAPMVEEVMFRGLLFGALRRWLQEWPTIILTAILFACVHLDILYFVPLFGLGLLLGWARQKSGSIWLPVVLHVTQNSFACLAIYAVRSLKNYTGG